MTPADNVLPKLECVRDFGNGRGIARCPAHDDKTPSLAWRICDDGTLLVKCWAGCGAHDIVDAIGLKLRDLFAGPIDRNRLGDFRPDLRQALAGLRLEATVVLIAADDISRGVTLSAADIERVQRAAGQIRNVVAAVRA
jgi:hypothetical protein